MFVFEEKFSCWDDAYKPYGIRVEASSNLWHKHARATTDGYTVYCTGNKYLLEMPETETFSLDLTYQYEALNSYVGISVYFGYDPEYHTGYELRMEWYKHNRTMVSTVYEIDRERYTRTASVTTEQVDFPGSGTEYTLSVCLADDLLTAVSNGGAPVSFSVSPRCGMLGFSRPDFIGNIRFRSVCARTEALSAEQGSSTSVTIPMVNGGTMPLRVEYRQFTVSGKPYLTATLDGGPQYRSDETYHPYPVNRKGQYVVERWFMTRPYIRANGKIYHFSMGEVNLTDPHLAWKELLYQLLHFMDLPLTMTVPLESAEISQYAFGYENLEIFGYRLQSGKNEFNFDLDGAYLGETVFPDTFRLCSPADKRAVSLIPETVFEYETVRSHFARNHYFAENEEIVFSVFAETDKSYISYEAELQTVYGEYMETVSVRDGMIRHAPLAVGVYRIQLTVLYGDAVLTKLDTVFEVFDETGERCAPLESGLPVLFSMPNEQQYLDRDPFDPWNTGAPANLEHFYSCTAFTGHVAEYKRTWEVTKRFGRTWYVWLSDHRTMVEHDYRNHMNILKNADYVYYPSDYEWAVLRSDCFTPGLWGQMPKTVELLNEFLDTHEGARELVGYTCGENVSRDHITKLHTYYQKEWYALLQQRLTACFKEQNETFTAISPNFKRACYGPFNVYVATMRTTRLSEAYGFEPGNALSDVIYTGFAQFEDYPYSCAYQTYRGAFGAGASLVHSPNLVIYPEQYKSSRGGCIDGAVYFANPPVGGYIMPAWFNTTLTREYVYNTARKTQEGFAYWNTYGFMKGDLTDQDIDPFIRDWKYVLQYQPKRPARSAVYICEFDRTDDGFEKDFPGWRAPYNISEEGIGYLYETSRLAGLPSGFFASWESFLTITADDTDLVILPSTVSASAAVLAHIRALHEAGVSIIAVSRIDGLEDLFGVRYAPQEIHYCGIETGTEHENVYPYEAVAGYEADDAETLMSADGTPLIFKNGNTVLFNISPAVIGRSYFFAGVESARSSVSTLLRKTCIRLMCECSSPIARTSDERCGITVFEDTHGNQMLLVIDYSVHDQSKIDTKKEKTIMFSDSQLHGAEAVDGKSIRRLIRCDGILDGITVELHPHESVLIRLF